MARNHTSFRKGWSGNPKGAPKKENTVRSLMMEAMDEVDELGVPFKVIVARKLVSLAVNGNIAAIKELNNRIDGLPRNSFESFQNTDTEIIHIYKPEKIRSL